MTTRNFPAIIAASLSPLAFLAPIGAHAQATLDASASLEASTDIRDRGLSQTGGKLGVALDGSLPITQNLVIDAKAETLRGSNRNGDSQFGLEIAPHFVASSEGWDFTAGARGHIYADAGELDYVELEGSVSRTLGPAWLTLNADYAPSQDAIGGSNLYLQANLGLGIPGTPLTAYAGVGHTMGTTSNAVRAVRLRPDGDYTDWYLAIERAHLNFTVGMELTGTSIDQDAARDTRYWDNDTGTRVSGYMRVAF
ncbi:hypothetical protein MTR62_12040 [Novosphingobium sp. 1949]|uniref:Outer membrane protein beta-barrel domain-containing protein n=1 Tax=Novosphingobium organovorum TaxID=2930092 RepID=A0ABT0BEK5_9SPHN|nr:TorF family putative porin [Novosphingobium organovorum]MCJ2183413.1 hypothetical protein [Novosphingobium organovorum]